MNDFDDPLHAIMDEEDARDAAAVRERDNAFREAAGMAQDFYRRWVMAINGFKGSRHFAFECGILALGWFDILGCDSQVALANRWKCDKENVGKLVKHIQRLTGAPPTPNQRGEAGRIKMAERRKKQLKG